MLNPIPSTANRLGKTAKPPPHLCPQCAHSNLPDARFCNACGAALSVMECPQCGAVIPAAADFCHQCHGEWQEGSAGDHHAVAAVLEPDEPVRRPPIPIAFWVVSAVILATLAYLGYHLIQMFSASIPFERAALPVRESSLEDQRGYSYSGIIERAPVAVESADQGGRDIAAPVLSVPTAETAPRNAARAPVADKRASRPATVLCTEELVAVGLCSREPERAQASQARAKSAAVPPPPNVARKAAVRTPVDTQPCTAGILALGLCKNESMERKE